MSSFYPNSCPPSIGLERPSKGEREDAAACREFQLKTATTLRLEFRLIQKVENLRALLSLRRLFLDNNLIERISGLDSLVHLEWLDLSFNRIRKIEGEYSSLYQSTSTRMNGDLSTLRSAQS